MYGKLILKEGKVSLLFMVSPSYFPSTSPPHEDLQGTAAQASNCKQGRGYNESAD